MTKHLDSMTIYALLDGELDLVEERNAEAHLLRCDECRAMREECGATLESLGWYADASPRPPAGYWEAFWIRFEERVRIGATGSGSADVRPIRRSWAGSAIAAAAVLALLIGTWWPGEPELRRDDLRTTRSVAVRAFVADSGWQSDVEFFERATVALGSVDPLSKGVVLATLVDSP